MPWNWFDNVCPEHAVVIFYRDLIMITMFVLICSYEILNKSIRSCFPSSFFSSFNFYICRYCAGLDYIYRWLALDLCLANFSFFFFPHLCILIWYYRQLLCFVCCHFFHCLAENVVKCVPIVILVKDNFFVTFSYTYDIFPFSTSNSLKC